MICFQSRKSVEFDMPERTQKPPAPAPWEPKQGDGDGPRSPDVSKPDTKDLLKRMRKVDPNQSKRYGQGTGQKNGVSCIESRERGRFRDFAAAPWSLTRRKASQGTPAGCKRTPVGC